MLKDLLPHLTALFGDASVYIQLSRFLIVLLLGVLFTKAVLIPAVRRVADRRTPGKKTLHSIENLAGIIGIFMAFTIALQAGEFGSLVTVIGAVAGAATVAIGWGMRDQVGSLVSGIFMHVYPSFVKGDYITAGDVSGTVKETTLIETRLRGPNGKNLILPNNYLTTRPVTNHTRGRITQDSITLSIRPEKLEEATEVLKRIGVEYDEVLNAPEPLVQYTGVEDAKVKTDLVYYVRDNQDVNDIRSTVLERFNKEAVELGLLADESVE